MNQKHDLTEHYLQFSNFFSKQDVYVRYALELASKKENTEKNKLFLIIIQCFKTIQF